jgi:hypothetical protein
MNEIPNLLQWVTLQDRVRTLAQLRFRIYDLYMEGSFLFFEARSCDDETNQPIFIVDPEGELL